MMASLVPPSDSQTQIQLYAIVGDYQASITSDPMSRIKTLPKPSFYSTYTSKPCTYNSCC